MHHYKTDISIKRLSALLSYEPESGNFRWKESRGRVKSGSVAGSIDGKGYITIKIDGENYRAHRLAALLMDGKWPPNDIDHVNRDRTDNRWSNLRHATRYQNCWNCRTKDSNTSGYPGVQKHGSGWVVRIRVKDRRLYLGTYRSKEEAISVRKEAEVKYHGQFARGDEK